MKNAYDYINNLIVNGCSGKKFVHKIIKDKYLINGIERTPDQEEYLLKTFNLDKRRPQLFRLKHLTLFEIIEK